MKHLQWALAIVALAGTVFAITFAMNYLGGGGNTTPSVVVAGARRLTFAFEKAPPESAGPLEVEEHQQGHSDFWFHNEHEAELRVGLIKVGCSRCTDVALYLLPADVGATLLASVGRVKNLSQPEKLAQAAQVQDKGEGRDLFQSEQAVAVPAGAVGWVRVSWKAEQAGPQSFTAQLWTEQKGTEGSRLQVAAVAFKPVRVRPLLDVGTLRDEELQGDGKEVGVECWSSTRDEFPLEARLGGAAGPAVAGTFVVGKPRPLTGAELKELEKRIQSETLGEGATAGRVRSGYRVPITLKGLAGDGKTPIELGPFRRTVLLSSAEGVEVPPVEVRGRVVGLLDVGGPDERGVLAFGWFRRGQGSNPVTLRLRGSTDLQLVLDEERSAKFVEVNKALLAKPEPEAKGHQAWKLRAEVPAGRASGEFPRPEDQRYADSAIYLKAVRKGKLVRTIRIPVTGTAGAG
jgi:hypothetical protein